MVYLMRGDERLPRNKIERSRLVKHGTDTMNTIALFASVPKSKHEAKAFSEAHGLTCRPVRFKEVNFGNHECIKLTASRTIWDFDFIAATAGAATVKEAFDMALAFAAKNNDAERMVRAGFQPAVSNSIQF